MNQKKFFVIAAIAVAGLISVNTLWGTPQDVSGDESDAPADVIASFTAIKGVDIPHPVDKGATMRVELIQDDAYDTLLYLSETGSLGVTPSPSNFQLATLELENAIEVVRYSASIGRAWMLKKNDKDAQEWILLDEKDSDVVVPVGDYEVQLLRSGENSMIVFRIDRRSGLTWFLDNDLNWDSIGEPVVNNQ